LEIYEAMQPFFSGKEMYDSYGILLRAKAAIDRSITLEEYGNRYVDAFYNVIRLYKAGKVRKSLRGLLYASWERLSAEISRQKAALAIDVMQSYMPKFAINTPIDAFKRRKGMNVLAYALESL